MADGDISTLRNEAEQRASSEPVLEPPRPGLRRWRTPLLITGPLLVLAVGLVAYSLSEGIVSIDNAFVKADVTTISTDVSGIVAEVAVEENQQVKAGALLYRLDNAPYRNTVANLEAQLATARNDIEALRARYRQHQQTSSKQKSISPITPASSSGSPIWHAATSRHERNLMPPATTWRRPNRSSRP